MTKESTLPENIRRTLEAYLSDLDIRIASEEESLKFVGGPLKTTDDPRRPMVEGIAKTIVAYRNAKKDLFGYFPELRK